MARTSSSNLTSRAFVLAALASVLVFLAGVAHAQSTGTPARQAAVNCAALTTFDACDAARNVTATERCFWGSDFKCTRAIYCNADCTDTANCAPCAGFGGLCRPKSLGCPPACPDLVSKWDCEQWATNRTAVPSCAWSTQAGKCSLVNALTATDNRAPTAPDGGAAKSGDGGDGSNLAATPTGAAAATKPPHADVVVSSSVMMPLTIGGVAAVAIVGFGAILISERRAGPAAPPTLPTANKPRVAADGSIELAAPRRPRGPRKSGTARWITNGGGAGARSPGIVGGAPGNGVGGSRTPRRGPMGIGSPGAAGVYTPPVSSSLRPVVEHRVVMHHSSTSLASAAGSSSSSSMGYSTLPTTSTGLAPPSTGGPRRRSPSPSPRQPAARAPSPLRFTHVAAAADAPSSPVTSPTGGSASRHLMPTSGSSTIRSRSRSRSPTRVLVRPSSATSLRQQPGGSSPSSSPTSPIGQTAELFHRQPSSP
ncbi:hypothetical protein H9P43_004681 [Blastocladiella emersonii ATCC 22665]|nr:hypothetical protein H9P43_004681 [Blastocladiella emersonii ATCC 22665]